MRKQILSLSAGKFIAKENDAKYYPNKDYHTMYIAEIVKILVAE